MESILNIKVGTPIEDSLQSSLQMDAWKDFETDGKVSDGLVDVYMEGGHSNNTPDIPVITQAQVNALTYLQQNPEKSRDAVLKTITEHLPEWETLYGDVIPKISDFSELKNHLSLRTLYIHPVEKDGVAYIGYELDCSWDPEHGVGILMHKEHMTDIGSAETAFHVSTAYEDSTAAANSSQSPKLPTETSVPTHTQPGNSPKPWWQFW